MAARPIGDRNEITGEWILALIGALRVLAGIIILAMPYVGAMLTAALFAAWAILSGAAALALGWRLRQFADGGRVGDGRRVASSVARSARHDASAGRTITGMRLVVVEFMTLDGVMEAPGFEEHRTGRNGWAMRVSDAELQGFSGQQIAGAGALLFGRTTFNIWAAFWPTAPEVAAAMARRIEALPKYVVSRTLPDSDWANTTILRGDLEMEIRRLKAQEGGDLLLYGSADLVAGVLELDLVDEMRILLFPVILGSGKRLFRDEADLRHLRLVTFETTASGVVILDYERAAEDPPTAADSAALYLWTDDQREFLRAAEETDRVLATVLFTDIVNSTGRAAELGDREWRRTLDRHDAAARAVVERWRGALVKPTGDGILARFDSPSRALRAALALCQAAKRIGIEIRAAVHTGEVEIRGGDIGGIGVHIASRVLAEAGAGEVVVTRTVRDLVAGLDVEFRSRVSVELRGVPGEWELFTASLR